MDLKTILREGLIFSDYEKVIKILEEYKIEEVIQHYIDENNKDAEELEDEISDLKDVIDDKERELDKMSAKLDKIQELLND